MKTKIFISILFLYITFQFSTQSLAYFFNYQKILGSNLFHIYLPWFIIKWSLKWWKLYPKEFTHAIIIGSFPSLILLSLFFLINIIYSNTLKTHNHLYGSARWANKKDIIKAGLLSKGVYIGAWQDPNGTLHYLRHNGPEHILAYAPTRSGKGVGLVIPTLLSWPHSAIITDLKGELWQLTAGWRKQYVNNRILYFEPSEEESLSWNPFNEIRISTPYEVGDVQNLVHILIDPDGKGLETHWQKTGFALLVGLILYGFEITQNENQSLTFSKIDEILNQTNLNELWHNMLKSNKQTIAHAASDMLHRSSEEAGSVLSTIKSYLSLYRDPIIAQNLKTSDFKITDFISSHQPISLYIIMKPNDKDRLRPLFRILINMIIHLLAKDIVFHNDQQQKHYKHRLLLMLDEFPSLRKLDLLQESLAFLAGYNIKCYLICQDLNQLKSKETGYGSNETITSNCHIQTAYPPNRLETAIHLSQLTGESTVMKEQITVSGQRTSAFLGKVSKVIHEIKRPLLTPDECLRMPGPLKNEKGEIETAGDMIISIAGFPAIYGKQILYFQDPIFRSRSKIPAPQKKK
jgi:type IV secretion system protein VirD4